MRIASYLMTFITLVAVSHGELRVVDLTHTFNRETVYWPGDPEFKFTIIYRGWVDDPGYWYELNQFSTADHGGTHLDAPAHFAAGHWRTAQIPIERLVGPGVILNVKEKAANNPDYRVTVQDLKDWENTNGKIPNKAVVLMNSGWTTKYPNKTLVFGTDQVNDSTTFHFPGFHEDAVQFLASERSINMIGVDTPSVDYGQTSDFSVHVTACKADIPGLENVANLDKVPVRGATIYAGVIKLFGGSGGPARIMATFEDDQKNSGCAGEADHMFGFILWVAVYIAFEKTY